eukprot:403361658
MTNGDVNFVQKFRRRLQRRQTENTSVRTRQLYGSQINPFAFNEQYINHILNRSLHNQNPNGIGSNRFLGVDLSDIEESPSRAQSNNESNNNTIANWASVLNYAKRRSIMQRQVKRDLVVNIVLFFAILIITLFSVKLDTKTCGYQHQLFLSIYTFFYLAKVGISVYLMFLSYRRLDVKARKVAMIKIIGFNSIQVILLLYGNVLFYMFDIEKECGKDQSDIQRLSTFVLIILIVGYIQLTYLLFAFIFLIAMMIQKKQPQNQVQNEDANIPRILNLDGLQIDNTIFNSQNPHIDRGSQANQYKLRMIAANINSYIDSLEKQKYKMDLDDIEQIEECAICLNKFESNEDIVLLKCDKRHSFHPDCAKEWIKIKATCPLCRQEFQDQIVNFKPNNSNDNTNSQQNSQNRGYRSNEMLLQAQQSQVIISSGPNLVRPPQPSRARVMVINMINEIDEDEEGVIIPLEPDIPDQVQGFDQDHQQMRQIRGGYGRRTQSNFQANQSNQNASIIQVINTISYPANNNPSRYDSVIIEHQNQNPRYTNLRPHEPADDNDSVINMRNFHDHLRQYPLTNRRRNREVRRYRSQQLGDQIDQNMEID